MQTQVALAEGLRITPARAGKRIGLIDVDGHSGDHPRMRGEKLLASCT